MMLQRALGSGLRTAGRSLAPTKTATFNSGIRTVAPRRSPLTPRMQLEMGGGAGAGSGGRGGRGGPGGKRLCATGGSGGEGAGDKSLWGKYLEALDTAPLITRAATCAVLNGLGDIFSQIFVEGGSSINVKRTALFCTLGLFYVGPVLFYWYSFLSKLIPGSSMAAVAGSLAMDQLVFAPVFVGSFIGLMQIIDGKGIEGAKAKLEEEWVNAIKVNWCIWVPAQFINFRFVPPQLRVLATNVTALVWNTYISWATYRTK